MANLRCVSALNSPQRAEHRDTCHDQSESDKASQHNVYCNGLFVVHIPTSYASNDVRHRLKTCVNIYLFMSTGKKEMHLNQ